MSDPSYDMDEVLWALYVNDCQQHHQSPSLKDYLVWCEERDYDRDD
jgi:hypothetical protein